jgi:diguanylate cyclase (GGDEF)-like protein
VISPQVTALREHIVCVDDEEGILAALRQQLSARFGNECDIAVAKNAREALDLIEDLQQDGEQVAVVIADQIMPGMKGVELLEEVHRRSPSTVKILLTGQAGLDAVVYAINRAGLDQYIPKPWDEPDLRLTIQNLLSRFRLERERGELLSELRTKNAELASLNSSLEEKVAERTRELETLNARLAELAITDGLTGLYNHRHFRERLSLEMERSNRTGLPLSVLMIDVDHFKGYNDRHGHLAGDNALRGVSKILQHGRRANDVVARYGGEEFAIILLDVGKDAAREVAERICAQIAEFPFEFGGTQPAGKLTISVGVASFPDDGAEPAVVLASADRALFAAKNAGRNRVRVAGQP